MTIIRKILNSRLKKIIQDKPHRNRAALACLITLGFPITRIRKALLDLNGITIQGLGNGEVSYPALYNALRGYRKNGPAVIVAKEKLAEPLGLNVKELFPDN